MSAWWRVVGGGAAIVIGAGVLVVATEPAHAATTARAWVSSMTINYEPGPGQNNTVTVKKVVGWQTWWEFSDTVPITPLAGCHHPFRTNTTVWCARGTAQGIVVATGDLGDIVAVHTPGTVV